MKRLTWSALVIAFVLSAFVSNTSAGVVMSETAIAKGPGDGDIQKRTIYIQGNKQKVERGGVDAITDLDKDVIYLVDRNQKEYVELPFGSQAMSQIGAPGGETIHLDNTGRKRVVAGRGCQEYRGSEGDHLQNVAVSVCVSDQIPGVNEVMAFQQRMLSRLGRTQQEEEGSKAGASGLVLEKLSVVSFRVPDLSRANSFRTASFVTRTNIDNIQVKRLPDDTFLPPRDFTRLGGDTAPASPRSVPDHNEYEVDAPVPAGSDFNLRSCGSGVQNFLPVTKGPTAL